MPPASAARLAMGSGIACAPTEASELQSSQTYRHVPLDDASRRTGCEHQVPAHLHKGGLCIP